MLTAPRRPKKNVVHSTALDQRSNTQSTPLISHGGVASALRENICSATTNRAAFLTGQQGPAHDVPAAVRTSARTSAGSRPPAARPRRSRPRRRCDRAAGCRHPSCPDRPFADGRDGGRSTGRGAVWIRRAGPQRSRLTAPRSGNNADRRCLRKRAVGSTSPRALLLATSAPLAGRSGRLRSPPAAARPDESYAAIWIASFGHRQGRGPEAARHPLLAPHRLRRQTLTVNPDE